MAELQDGVAADPLDDLLLRWQELRDQGSDPAPEELCAGRPELAAPLRERIEAIRAMEQALGLSPETLTEEPPTPDAPTPSLPGREGAAPGGARPAPLLPGYE